MVCRLGAWAAHSAMGSLEVEGLKRVSTVGGRKIEVLLIYNTAHYETMH